jgi:phytanoyl-CoA hydroxylase
MSLSNLHFAEVDAGVQEVITDEQAQFFIDNGFLIIRNVIQGDELRLLQDQNFDLVEKGIAGVVNDPDFLYRIRNDGERVYWRTEFVIDKQDANKVLLGHPFILRTVEKLQGNNFIATWDSLVVKVPNNAASVPWHRDAAVPFGCTDPRPIFNVDFYLDSADEKSCLWVIPGSNHWDAEASQLRCSQQGFDFEGAVPVPMNPGDVILHNIQLLHGSPEGDGNALRRTIYYEFRPGEVEFEFGPHTLEYLTLKQQVLLACIERRKQAPYAQGEKPYEYRPSGALAVSEPKRPETYRVPHEKYWRAE